MNDWLRTSQSQDKCKITSLNKRLNHKHAQHCITHIKGQMYKLRLSSTVDNLSINLRSFKQLNHGLTNPGLS